MRGSSFGYLLREGAKNIYANRLMSFASIGTLVACMLLIGGSLLFSMNINRAVGYVEQQNEVEVELDDGLSDEQIKEVDKEITLIDNVYERKFVSKDALMEELKAQSDDLAALLDGLEEDNPLYDSYRLKVKDLSRLSSTVMKLESLEGVSAVRAPDMVGEIMTNVKRAVSSAGYFIVAILLVVSLVIMGNTIKVTVFNRRKEINIKIRRRNGCVYPSAVFCGRVFARACICADLVWPALGRVQLYSGCDCAEPLDMDDAGLQQHHPV
jgi:cell division transport system permease protein